jgi:eukaryotic-like serine/threonine-protein kinase
MSTEPPPPDAAAPTVEGFLKTVLRSGLLNEAQLRAALRDVPREGRGDPHALAEHLVRAGKLSRFQADKLLRGTALGLVLGPFQILAPIGKGGMGTVYLSRDERSGQLMALKILPPRRARLEERMLARFRREMEMSQRVAHPHLAWTYEAGEHRGAYYIAMEYIPGKTLSRLVTEEGPLPLARGARLMAEVASGLEHAHNQGLIHRDLKPSNILVTPRDHAKVLDLGLALIRGEKVDDAMVVGGQGYIVGTMDYIAPEQTYDASAVDPRCDIYALGCVLYYALAGRPPFSGGTSKEKIHRHRTEEPMLLSNLRPDLPGPFVMLVHRMMAKDPQKRPPSAAAVEHALRAWAAGEPAQPPERPGEQTYDAEAVVLEADAASEFSGSELPAVGEERRGDESRVVRELTGGAAPWWVVPLFIGGVMLLAAAAMVLVLVLLLR